MYLVRIDAKSESALIECLRDIVAKHTPPGWMHWIGETPEGKWLIKKCLRPHDDAMDLVEHPL